MTTHELHWGEGLFLRPQHFQATERRLRETVRNSENWLVGYTWGLRKIEIDEDALQNWRVSLNVCHVRLHDGTHLQYPESADLSPVVVPREAFGTADGRVMIYLAVPRLRLGHRNVVGDDARSGDMRYTVESIEVEDENQPGNPQLVEFRRYNAQLMSDADEVAGYEALPIMRLRLGTTAEAPPEVDPDYIPPLLACDAWARLQNLIRSVYDTLGGTAEMLASQMKDRGVAFESGHREDLERILKLQAVNTSLGGISHMPFVQGIHPLDAYTELCRVVGRLAIFRAERKMPSVPQYDHDDLATCFHAIRDLLDVGEQQDEGYVKRPFIGAGLQMQVRLDREWLEPSWTFYIGVESELAFNDIDQLLMQRLDMKVGSTDEVDATYRFARAGARLVAEASPPRDFPRNRWTYWRVDRTSEAWQAVEKTLGLGIRFNERQVEGEIDGEQRVQIYNSDDGTLTALSFALYAMKSRG